MGDAGPPTPPPLLSEETALVGNVEAQDAPPLREVKVLVTGFGVSCVFPFTSDLLLSGFVGGQVQYGSRRLRERSGAGECSESVSGRAFRGWRDDVERSDRPRLETRSLLVAHRLLSVRLCPSPKPWEMRVDRPDRRERTTGSYYPRAGFNSTPIFVGKDIVLTCPFSPT